MSRPLPTRPREVDQLSEEVQLYIRALEEQVEQLRLKLQDVVRRDENRTDQQALKMHINTHERSDESLMRGEVSDDAYSKGYNNYDDDDDDDDSPQSSSLTDCQKGVMERFLTREMLAISRSYGRPKDSHQ